MTDQFSCSESDSLLHNDKEKTSWRSCFSPCSLFFHEWRTKWPQLLINYKDFFTYRMLSYCALLTVFNMFLRKASEIFRYFSSCYIHRFGRLIVQMFPWVLFSLSHIIKIFQQFFFFSKPIVHLLYFAGDIKQHCMCVTIILKSKSSPFLLQIRWKTLFLFVR